MRWARYPWLLARILAAPLRPAAELRHALALGGVMAPFVPLTALILSEAARAGFRVGRGDDFEVFGLVGFPLAGLVLVPLSGGLAYGSAWLALRLTRPPARRDALRTWAACGAYALAPLVLQHVLGWLPAGLVEVGSLWRQAPMPPLDPVASGLDSALLHLSAAARAAPLTPFALWGLLAMLLTARRAEPRPQGWGLPLLGALWIAGGLALDFAARVLFHGA